MADEEVRKWSTPKKIIKCGLIDLSVTDNSRLDYSHEALSMGSRITVIDDALGETLTTRVTAIQRDLAAPLGIAIEVEDPEGVPDSGGATASILKNPPRKAKNILDTWACACASATAVSRDTL